MDLLFSSQKQTQERDRQESEISKWQTKTRLRRASKKGNYNVIAEAD